jgi:hypothetical protein
MWSTEALLSVESQTSPIAATMPESVTISLQNGQQLTRYVYASVPVESGS